MAIMYPVKFSPAKKYMIPGDEFFGEIRGSRGIFRLTGPEKVHKIPYP